MPIEIFTAGSPGELQEKYNLWERSTSKAMNEQKVMYANGQLGPAQLQVGAPQMGVVQFTGGNGEGYFEYMIAVQHNYDHTKNPHLISPLKKIDEHE